MKFLKDRNLIIIAIVGLLLIGGFYLTNNNSDQNKEDTSKEDQVELEEKDDKTNNTNNGAVITTKGVVSVEPSSNASLTKGPNQVVIRVDKELTSGSEITIVSDKGVDVVSGGNKLTRDLKTLTAPAVIDTPGTYTVGYKLNWANGETSVGSYKFVVK